MSRHDYDADEALRACVQYEGTITDIFGHRFVLTDALGKKILVDLGKHNQDRVRLETGAAVVALGRMKPTELKAESLTVNGTPVKLIAKEGHKMDINHEKPDPKTQRDLADVIRAAEDCGLTVIGQRLKPAHAEILGMSQDNELTEMHIAFDGTVRASKPVAPDDQKWSKDLAAA